MIYLEYLFCLVVASLALACAISRTPPFGRRSLSVYSLALGAASIAFMALSLLDRRTWRISPAIIAFFATL